MILYIFESFSVCSTHTRVPWHSPPRFRAQRCLLPTSHVFCELWFLGPRRGIRTLADALRPAGLLTRGHRLRGTTLERFLRCRLLQWVLDATFSQQNCNNPIFNPNFWNLFSLQKVSPSTSSSVSTLFQLPGVLGGLGPDGGGGPCTPGWHPHGCHRCGDPGGGTPGAGGPFQPGKPGDEGDLHGEIWCKSRRKWSKSSKSK